MLFMKAVIFYLQNSLLCPTSDLKEREEEEEDCVEMNYSYEFM